MRCLLPVSIVLSVLLAAPVFGQEVEKRDEAMGFYVQAKAAFEAGKFGQAIDYLDRAYRLHPDPNILIKKAQCLEKLLKLDEALQYYRQAQHEDSTGPMNLSPSIRAKTATTIRSLEAELKKPIRLLVSCNIAGAEVIIDGKSYLPPVELELQRGEHRYEAKRMGYSSIPERSFTVQGRTSQNLFLILKELSGNYSIRRNDQVLDVRVDGILLDRWEDGKSYPLETNAGMHELVCEYPEGGFWSEFVVLKDMTVTVDCPRFPIRTGPVRFINKPLPATLLTIGVGSLVASGLMFAGYAEDHNIVDECYAEVTTSKFGWGVGLGAIGLLATSAGTYLWFAED